MYIYLKKCYLLRQNTYLMSIATQDPQVVPEFLFIYTLYTYSFLICLQEPIAPILAQKQHQDSTKKHRRSTAYLTDQTSNSIKYLA